MSWMPRIWENLESAYAPWHTSPRPKSREREGYHHYHGWTLVDRGRSYYAVNDETGDAVRVCRVGELTSFIVNEFRRKVDEREGSA